MKPTGPVFDSGWRASCVVRSISRADAEPMIRAHYIGKWPGVCVLLLGLFHEGNPAGVIVFALPPRETNKRYGGATWELARLWVDDALPANVETYFISRALRHIRKHHADVRTVVSYADPSAGHSDVIYRAANFKLDGRTDDDRKTPRFDYADARTGVKYSRRCHVPADAVLVRVPRVSKHRYRYDLMA
jgi:hypothetical protein